VAVEVFMPKMTDHMAVGELIRWLVDEGDSVEAGQAILEVMTDKIAVELEAPASGILKGIRAGAEEGVEIPVGETIAFVAEPDEDVPNLPPLAPTTSQAGQETLMRGAGSPVETPDEPAGVQPGKVRAAPAVRRIARELGVGLALVTGSGPGGRIREEDVRAFAESHPAKPPDRTETLPASPVARRLARELGIDLADVRGTGPNGRITREDVEASADAASTVTEIEFTEEDVEWLDLTPIQRRTGQRMIESTQTVPQFALTAYVDVTAAVQLRQSLMERVLVETGERLSFTAILVKIVAAALKHYPRANASFEEGRVKLHRRINVGVAVGTDEGLVVPVVKDADQKSLVQIVKHLRSFQDKASAMRFESEDLSGGSFTISNLGMYGIDHFHAIINPPESAILAVGRIVNTPAGMPDGSIALRPTMSLTLTVDHRSMDGIQGARFLAEVRQRLEQPYLLL